MKVEDENVCALVCSQAANALMENTRGRAALTRSHMHINVPQMSRLADVDGASPLAGYAATHGDGPHMPSSDMTIAEEDAENQVGQCWPAGQVDLLFLPFE